MRHNGKSVFLPSNAQGASRLFLGTAHRPLRGQGATEYLVLLAVVLIIALISISLLGFFPGLSTDSKVTQHKTYWMSARPISIVESFAMTWTHDASMNTSMPYIRLKNMEGSKIVITKIFIGDKYTELLDSDDYGTVINLSSTRYLTLGPGEEAYISGRDGSNRCGPRAFGVPFDQCIKVTKGADTSFLDSIVGGATQVCTGQGGFLEAPNFGFEYIVVANGQEITKMQIGAKSLLIKCRAP